MPPHVDPVASDPTLPASARVVVIGGGIIGVGTTFFLASKGVPVVPPRACRWYCARRAK